MDRLDVLKNFYYFLGTFEQRLGGRRSLGDLTRKDTPLCGVYFFFELGEERSQSGSGPRVVRVGTHALTATSKSTLWTRLLAHRGFRQGGGNHRGSIFRLLIGDAIQVRDHLSTFPLWGRGSSESRDVRDAEQSLERLVSQHIGKMSLVWVEVNQREVRSDLEQQTIGLVSNYHRASLDPQSSRWLGQYSTREKVRRSGLWNSNHVDQNWSERILTILQAL